MMKKLSKIALLAAASAFMLAVFPACGDDDGDGESKDPVPSVKITGDTSVTVGGTPIELTATVSNFPEGVSYEWTSSAEDKATVEKNSDDPSKATVTALVEGTTIIKVMAKSGDTEKSDEVTVTVNAAGTPNVSGGDVWIWDATEEGWTADGTLTETTKSKDGHVSFAQNINTKKAGNIQVPSRNVPTANDWSTAEKIVYFTVPAGTNKIVVNLRTGSSSNGSNVTVVSKADLTKPVFQKNYPNNKTMAAYEDCEITFPALSAETEFYIFNNKESSGNFKGESGGGGLNIKKITLSK